MKEDGAGGGCWAASHGLEPPPALLDLCLSFTPSILNTSDIFATGGGVGREGRYHSKEPQKQN